MNTKPDTTAIGAVRPAVETAGAVPAAGECYSGMRRMTTLDSARASGQNVLSSSHRYERTPCGVVPPGGLQALQQVSHYCTG